MIEKIKELKKTEKGRTLLKLILYLIFFGLVVIMMISVNSSSNPNNSTNSSGHESLKNDAINEETLEKELTYFEKQERFEDDSYKFNIKVTTSLSELSFIGEYKEGITTGIKETQDEVLRYSIENDKIYKLKLSEKEEYLDLYKDLDENLFDYNYLFSKLNSITMQIEKDSDVKRYTYTEYDNYNITVTTNKRAVTNIHITNDELIYDFNFEF